MEASGSEKKPIFGTVSWEEADGLAERGIVTISLHQHGQERNRMKKPNDGGDFQFFDLDDFGITGRFEKMILGEVGLPMALNGTENFSLPVATNSMITA